MKTLVFCSLLLLSTVFCPVITFAHWILDGVPVGTSAATGVSVATDGAKGAIITWSDARNGNFDVFAQRVDSSGVALWTANGVNVCTAAGNQSSPSIVSDGAGGAIITWTDGDIYAQRVNAAGVAQWTTNGVVICTATGFQTSPVLISDGAAGAIITWQDGRGASDDIYAQRINAAGTVQWTANGVAICAATNTQAGPKLTTDGSGGAIVTWYDLRSGVDHDIYAQKVNSSGAVQWTANGVAICTATDYQQLPAIVDNGSGGAWITWMDHRLGTWDIYAQKINSSGTPQLLANGVIICQAANSQNDPRIISDGAGGTIITWWDGRTGSGTDIYAQHLNAAGTTTWTADGVAVCTATDLQRYPELVTDGAGGAIITWEDYRNVAAHIYARQVTAAGVAQWTADGVPVSTAVPQQNTPVIVSNGSGGAIIAWPDLRPGVYAQRLEPTRGYWGDPRPTLTSVADVAGDQGGKVKVNWLASDWDAWDIQTITYYSVWRATDPAMVANLTAGAVQPLAVNNPSEVPSDFAGRALWIQHLSGADYYWEWLGNVNGHYLSAYSYTASTRSDSTAQGAADERFFVSAQTGNQFVFFDSGNKTGHSVDNIAPGAPLLLTAQRVGADVKLNWNRVRVSDLRNYTVYRAMSSGVTPVAGNFLSNAPDSLLTDANAPTGSLYYIVTANDVHGNMSQPSNEAAISPETGVGGNLPPVTALTVLQNRPNPFAGETQLQIGLPAKGDVRVEIYDVAGRRVREVNMASRAQGWSTLRLDARDSRGVALPSGVYFYRVRAGAETVTKKMVIAR